MEIKNTQSQKITHINMLVYGPPGSGKTTLASTSPKPLIADCEQGLLSIRDKNLDYVTIKTWEDFEQFLKFIETDKDHETIIIDSVTELTKKLKDKLQNDHDMVQKDGSLTMKGWGVLVDKTAKLLRYLRDLDKNTIVIATVHEESDEGKLMKRPALFGKSLPTDACAFVDIVGYLQVINDKRVLCVSPDEKYYAKDRSNTLQKYVEPDFQKIYDAVIQNKQFVWTRESNIKEATLQKEFEKGMEVKQEIKIELKQDKIAETKPSLSVKK